jgi:hypothetical protein
VCELHISVEKTILNWALTENWAKEKPKILKNNKCKSWQVKIVAKSLLLNSKIIEEKDRCGNKLWISSING